MFLQFRSRFFSLKHRLGGKSEGDLPMTFVEDGKTLAVAFQASTDESPEQTLIALVPY